MKVEEKVTDRDSSVSPARRTWRRVALAILVFLLVVIAGVAGVAIGRSTAPGPTLVVMPGPIVEESTSADDLSVSGQLAADVPAIFTPGPDLDDTPTTASGYRLSRAGLDGAEIAQGLAAVFGVVGDAVPTSDGWTVGAAANATLTVNDDPTLSWTFVDPQAQEAAKGGAFVSPARAKATARALLSGIGVDPEMVDWRVNRFDTSLAVTAAQLLGDARTSLGWQLSFGQGDAVVSASGFAADLVEVPAYDVVGAATAVRRAALPTWSLIGPTPSVDTALAPLGDASGSGEETSVESSTLQVDVSSIVIADGELGLAEFRQPDGSVLILPAYQLTGDDGSRWSLIAVTGDAVDFVDVPLTTATVPAS